MTGEAAIGIAIRDAYPRALARVLAAVRRLDVAEDALHDAIERALVRWPTDGVPSSIEGWLVTVALNRRRDELRHVRRAERHEGAVTLALGMLEPGSSIRNGTWDDELLRLVVTACDPVLSPADGAALALATAVGLTTSEIARAFQVEERAMEQRLVRARRRLREDGHEYVVPPEPVALDRLEPVMTALYLLFNEGHWSSDGAPAIRGELCALALELAVALARIAPDEPDLDALVALMLVHEARRATRMAADGAPVPLPQQDRARWDQRRIAEASVLLRRRDPVLGDRTARRWEAEIALLHASAPSADATDWRAIANCYAALERVRPSPSVRINRGYAVGQAHGPTVGLSLLDEVSDDVPYAAFVRGVLLAEAGELERARASLDHAATATRNPHELAEIARRLASLR